MKIKFFSLLLIVSGLVFSSKTYSQVQNHWTTVGSTSSGWYSYNVPGTPPGWPNVCGQSANSNWGAPIQGTGGSGQFTNAQNLFPVGNRPVNPSNFVWGIGSPLGFYPNINGTLYFKFNLYRDINTCKRVRLFAASDEGRTIRVNGTIVQQVTAWNFLTQIDITDQLVCGNNCIMVEVINTGNPNTYHDAYFTANLQITDININFSGQAAYNTNVKCSEDLILTGGNAVLGATYSWAGPNGFTSNQRNPAPILNASTKHKGVYTCTMTLGCCSKTSSVTVDFEDCDKCEVDFNINYECDQLKVTSSSRFVDINCAVYLLDGVNIDPNTFYYVTRGEEHEICMHYLGTQKSDPNKICYCEEVCETINIEGPQTVTENYTYCNTPPNSGYEYYPCDGNYTSYSVESSGGVPTMQLCNTTDVILLDEGIYTINYYDENVCLKLVKTINVTKQIPQIKTCHKEKIKPCGVDFFNIDDIESYEDYGTQSSCNCDMEPGDNIYKEIVDGSSQVYANGDEIATIRYYNSTKCEICEISYLFKLKRCDFTAVIGQYTNSASPDQIYFVTNVSVTPCDDDGIVWQFFDNEGNLQPEGSITPAGPPEPNPANPDEMLWTFNVEPGLSHGKAIATICVCICPSERCCKDFEINYYTVNGSDMRILPNDNSNKVGEVGKQGTFIKEKVKNVVPFNIQLTPNPTSSKFSITDRNNEKLVYDNVTILDNSSKVVGAFKNMSSDYSYDLSDKSKGIYYVRVNIGQITTTLKLILN